MMNDDEGFEGDEEPEHNGHTVERRHTVNRRVAVRRSSDWWSETKRKIKELSFLIAIVAGIFSGVGFMLGPVLGKRIADDARETIAVHARALILDSLTNARQDRDMSQIRDTMALLMRRSESANYMLCEMYGGMFVGSPKPESCSRKGDVR